jgi:hypothetical protein
MTKVAKTLAYSAAGAAIGSISGFAFGCIRAAGTIATAPVAPVAYPVMSGLACITGAQAAEMEPQETAIMGTIGAAWGLCCVPLAPVFVATAPLAPIFWTGIGLGLGTVGGIVASREEKEENNYSDEAVEAALESISN